MLMTFEAPGIHGGKSHGNSRGKLFEGNSHEIPRNVMGVPR